MVRQIETEEKKVLSENPEEDFQKVKNLLSKKNKYQSSYILKQLHDKENLRRTFLAVVRSNPARISDLVETTLINKSNLYALLPNLITLGIVERVWVSDVLNGKIDSLAIRNKALDWTSKMEDNTKRYYLSKTSYWQVTPLGKKFVMEAYKFEEAFKEKDDE